VSWWTNREFVIRFNNRAGGRSFDKFKLFIIESHKCEFLNQFCIFCVKVTISLVIAPNLFRCQPQSEGMFVSKTTEQGTFLNICYVQIQNKVFALNFTLSKNAYQGVCIKICEKIGQTVTKTY
jgi:hypothetical protein